MFQPNFAQIADRQPAAWTDYLAPQDWAQFTAREHGVWDMLFARQLPYLGSRIVTPFLEGIPALGLDEPGIPDPHNNNTKVYKNIPRPAHQTAVGQRTMKVTAAGPARADLIDHVFLYGTPGDHPIVGDWNGDGTHTVAVFRDGSWRRDTDGDGRWSPADAAASLSPTSRVIR